MGIGEMKHGDGENLRTVTWFFFNRNRIPFSLKFKGYVYGTGK
jgi:hypothetical protein